MEQTNLSQQPITLADGTVAKYEIVVATSGAGKTSTGDYFEKHLGFTHVDGDHAPFNLHKPEYRAIYKNFE